MYRGQVDPKFALLILAVLQDFRSLYHGCQGKVLISFFLTVHSMEFPAQESVGTVPPYSELLLPLCCSGWGKTWRGTEKEKAHYMNNCHWNITYLYVNWRTNTRENIDHFEIEKGRWTAEIWRCFPAQKLLFNTPHHSTSITIIWLW